MVGRVPEKMARGCKGPPVLAQAGQGHGQLRPGEDVLLDSDAQGAEPGQEQDPGPCSSTAVEVWFWVSLRAPGGQGPRAASPEAAAGKPLFCPKTLPGEGSGLYLRAGARWEGGHGVELPL